MSTYDSSAVRLVCGVDNSEHAVDVVALASQLAGRLGLVMRVVHSAYPSTFVIGERRKELLAEGAAFLGDLVPDVPVEERVVELGDPVELVQCSLTENGVMAVVGSRGLGAARTALLGSVSRSLAGWSACPVVIVPPLASVKLGTAPVVICGVDGSGASDFALEHAAALASALGGRLTAVNVCPEGARALATVEGAVARLGIDIPIRLRTEQGDPAVRLRAVAAEHASAILVVGAHGRSGLLGGLGSVTSHLAANAPAPVMVVPTGIGPGAVRLWAPRQERVDQRASVAAG
jgi:nucleotide-binding universal stress UspA family protein